MKVIVQNGAVHALSRQEVEAMVRAFPKAWSHRVKSIVLYQGNELEARVSFHPKEQIIGLHGPSASTVSPQSKAKAIEALLPALAIVAERGELPARLSPSLRSRLAEQTSELRGRCLALTGNHTEDPATFPDCQTS
ncbi:MAG: hypothetical protein WAV95_04490 [Azonexus sp.]